ncbi:MAG: stage II sporulation protein M, partial [Bacteroidia bacterium]|nr:stage II sporulation protein M [Bacteroidia bacterium]
MKEITFLKQNAQKWEEYEKLAGDEKNIEPARLTEMFVEITDDLSYVNTNYKQTKTAAYVNGIASRIHQLVYKNKREHGNRFITFFTQELPAIFGHYHKQLFYS